MAGISVVILTLNEEDYIGDCLETVTDWVDEIIIIDSYSSDRTVEIAREYTGEIYQIEQPADEGYDDLRAVGIDHASYQWILDIDADMIVPKPLANRLEDLADAEDCDAVEIPSKHLFFRQWAKGAGWWPDHSTRFYRKDVVTITDDLHNFIHVSDDAVVCQVPASEEFALVHFNYDTITEMIDSMNRYSTIEASQREFALRMVFLEPFWEFGVRYLYQGGWKLGGHGLVLCLLRLWYRFVLAAKTYYYDANAAG